MRVYLGSDHAGYELKAHLVDHLRGLGYEVVDVGPQVYDPDDDYPGHCIATGERAVADPGSLAVVIGGSGNGAQIAANQVVGGGAARAWNPRSAPVGRVASRARIPARTLTCEDPPPTRPRRPRSVSRSSSTGSASGSCRALVAAARSAGDGASPSERTRRRRRCGWAIPPPVR